MCEVLCGRFSNAAMALARGFASSVFGERGRSRHSAFDGPLVRWTCACACRTARHRTSLRHVLGIMEEGRDEIV